jgi:hypothetical protein
VRRQTIGCLAAVLIAGVAPATTAGSALVPPSLLLVIHENITNKTSETLFTVLPTQGNALAASSVSVYVPAGYSLNLAYPPGTPIGALVDASSFQRSDLTPVDPATVTTDPCAPGAHAAVWQAGAVHVFVDPTTGDEASKGAYRLTYCQTAPILFLLEGVVTTPAAPGIYTWRAFVTPPAATGSPPDPSTIYELRETVPLPHPLKAKAAYNTRTHALVVTGHVTAGTVPEANAQVDVEQIKGQKVTRIGTTTTKADGSFTIKKSMRRTKSAQTLQLTASAEVPPGPCVDPPLAPAGCFAQTAAPSDDYGFTARIPKLPKPRPKH